MTLQLDERQRAMLHAMGISPLVLPPLPAVAAAVAQPSAARGTATNTTPSAPSPAALAPQSATPAAARTSLRSSLSGLTIKDLKQGLAGTPPVAAPVAAPEPTTATTAAVTDDAIAQADSPALQQLITDCTRCHLRQAALPPCAGSSAAHVREGAGAPDYAALQGGVLLLIDQPQPEGQALQPMPAEAAQLLRNILRAARLAPAHVFVTPVVKCAATQAVDASALAACAPYWQRQMALMQPRAVVLLGRLAQRAALGTPEPLGKLREQAHTVGGAPAFASYPPEFLLRNPQDKAKAWQDWQRVMAVTAPTTAPTTAPANP